MADEIVIYNLGYDDEVIKCEYLRQGRDHYMYPEKLKCCMKPCTDICQLPNPRGYSGYKFAKLTEAHKHFFGMPQADAHDAGADVRATRDVWLKLREIKRV
jgi:DNA polymerase-3 subunit alpha